MKTPTILLIEDSPEDARLIATALARVVPREQIGVCADGAAALDFFSCRGTHADRNPMELPVFVLLDLNLPRVGGLDVLREIRSRPTTRLLPVTVLSASARPEDIYKAVGLRANSYVRKPIDGRRLTETLTELARYWLDINVPPPIPIHR